MSVEKRKTVQKAIILAQQGRYDRAIAEYKAMIDSDPSDSSLHNALGDLYAHIGSTQEAIACYQRRVDALRADGLDSHAIALYKKIIRLDPNNLPALIACADLYAAQGFRAEAHHRYLLAAEQSLKLGFDKQAWEVYERLLRLEPLNPSVAARLASLLVRKGKRSEAVDLLGRLAQELRGKGRLDDARLLCQQMVEVAPETFTGWYYLGRIEVEAGRYKEAEKALERAGQIDATSPLPHLLLAQFFEKRTEPRLAKAAWHAVLRCDPKHQEAHHRLGLLYLAEGDREAAVGELDAAACSLSESGEPERAIAVLGELGPSSNHPLVQERLGELFQRVGRPEEAKGAFRLAAELYHAAGEKNECNRVLRRLLALNPADPDALAAGGASSFPEDGLVTPAVPEHLPSAPSAATSGVAESGDITSLQEMGDVAGEVSRIVEQANGESLTFFGMREGSAGSTHAALSIVEFYLDQGMEAEARALLRRVVASDPGNAEASHRLASLEVRALTEGTEDTVASPEIELVQSKPPERDEGTAILEALLADLEEQPPSSSEGIDTSHDLEESEKGFGAMMAELEAGLLSRETDPGSRASLENQRGEDHDSHYQDDRVSETCEAHFKLGIAYRELGLLDEAIEEFRRSAAENRLRLRACNMVGLCLLDKGDAEAAIHELAKGLSLVGWPEEEYHAIKYDLAAAYQSNDDPRMAVVIFRDLQTNNPSFRDVTSRLRELEDRLNQDKGISRPPKGHVDAARQAPWE